MLPHPFPHPLNLSPSLFLSHTHPTRIMSLSLPLSIRLRCLSPVVGRRCQGPHLPIVRIHPLADHLSGILSIPGNVEVRGSIHSLPHTLPPSLPPSACFYPFHHLSIFLISQSLSLSLSLSVSLCVYQSAYLPPYLTIHLSTYLPTVVPLSLPFGERGGGESRDEWGVVLEGQLTRGAKRRWLGRHPLARAPARP